MLLLFVHGWSVTDTQTYGGFPEALAEHTAASGLDIDIQHIWLGRYISFDDEVRMADIVKAFDRALREQVPNNRGRKREFSCVTHSTGGPVIREWIEQYFGAKRLEKLPLRHLVMLAPANHGSPLAKIGKQRVGRIKAWFSGVEPGEKILSWLCLGSADQWDLSEKHLAYQSAEKGFFPFVLTGQSIDEKFYDFMNSYLKEVGSDGVVRVSGANMNYTMLKLVESQEEDEVEVAGEPTRVQLLEPKGGVRRPEGVPLGVLPKTSHSGDKMGIMQSVRPGTASPPLVIEETLRCLSVESVDGYREQADRLDALTEATQESDTKSKRERYNTIVFRVSDSDGAPIDDCDIFLLGGGTFDPAKVPKQFFVDSQKNNLHPNTLIYYVKHKRLMQAQESGIGFRFVARPAEEREVDLEDRENFVYYRAAEYRMTPDMIAELLRPNETVYVDVELKRRIDKQVFRLDSAAEPRVNFKRAGPSGDEV